MEKKLVYIILILNLNPAFSQWKQAEKIDLQEAPTAYSSDFEGNIYLGYQDGSLVKYDPFGKEVINYALSNQSAISFIDTQFQLKTFLFYFDNQVVTILDRFGSVPKHYQVSTFTGGIVSNACPSPDGSIWLLENNPLVLKRIDPNRGTLLLEIQPPLGAEVRWMKTHQNLLLIQDNHGISSFDQFGNQLYSLPINARSATLLNGRLICLTDKEVVTYDAFKGNVVQKMPLPFDADKLIYLSPNAVFLKGTQLIVAEIEN